MVVEAYSELVGVLDQAQHLGVAKQRLAGDAPPVEAYASHFVALHHSGLHAKLARANRRDVPAGSGPQHHNVVVRQISTSSRAVFPAGGSGI